MQKTLELDSLEATQQFGKRLGMRLRGGEVLELSGDVGTGKTTFVKAVCRGLGIEEIIQSPTFTISRVYDAPNDLVFYHYDFYRLSDPGIMRDELTELLEDPANVVAIEWDDTVKDVLPPEKTVSFAFSYTGENSRKLHISGSEQLQYLFEES